MASESIGWLGREGHCATVNNRRGRGLEALFSAEQMFTFAFRQFSLIKLLPEARHIRKKKMKLLNDCQSSCWLVVMIGSMMRNVTLWARGNKLMIYYLIMSTAYEINMQARAHHTGTKTL